jgi:hypothetical protein
MMRAKQKSGTIFGTVISKTERERYITVLLETVDGQILLSNLNMTSALKEIALI